MYGEGLARFAASNYSRNATNGGRRDQYLTNTSVVKLVAALSKLTWTFSKLRRWFGAHGHDPDAIFTEMHRAVASVLVLSEPAEGSVPPPLVEPPWVGGVSVTTLMVVEPVAAPE